MSVDTSAEAPRYHIRTVADLFAVPDDKIEHCLHDLLLWRRLTSEARAFLADVPGIVVPIDTFTWIDDGKHDAHVVAAVVNGREKQA